MSPKISVLWHVGLWGHGVSWLVAPVPSESATREDCRGRSGRDTHLEVEVLGAKAVSAARGKPGGDSL
jgi:hypothetical protein